MPKPNNEYIPVIPMRDVVVFPGTVMPLRIGRDRSVAALEKARASGNQVLLVSQSASVDNKDPQPADLYRVGTLAKIEKVRGTAEQGFQVVVRADTRFRITEFSDRHGFLEAKGEVWPDRDVGTSDDQIKTHRALLVSLKKMASDILTLLPTDTSQLATLVQGVDDLSYLSYLCAAHLEAEVPVRQSLLEDQSVKDRVLRLLELLQQQKGSLQIQSEIRERLAKKMSKAQREAILRQHLDAIRDELGEGDDKDSGANYKKRITDAGMPADVEKVAQEELQRLEILGKSSPESHVIRNYLDLLCALPWAKSSGTDLEIDLDSAKETLDHDHYGLDKVKKRILQHLAVMKLTQKRARGQIILLVGPPGVGKTSLGQSIARALGRKFVRGSLGGVRDDAEIRGHRRTYIGAMPGRIIQGLKRAGENNPVFMLDEIDKLARGLQGDPASALLEVLDPEQNASFLDHYLDVPFDLSKVVFIATANTLDSIPGPLLDRMEVIDLAGYTSAEKLHIAKRHLVAKQLEEHGLKPTQVVISDEALLRIITHYTREAGVRDLQRNLASVCRSATERVVKAGPETSLRIEVADLAEALGPEKFAHEVAETISYPGVVTGLAWTPQGGEILFIETSRLPGKGGLMITGQLGDVMKESAQIALTLVRSNLPGVSGVGLLSTPFDYEKTDLHVHVPAGAIPKDGPSAGVALFTALASLVSGVPVNPKLAMTGEITLRGAVMPVGGIKEKVLAAHRAGIQRLILARRNERDLIDVPAEVKAELSFEFVDTVADVLAVALRMKLKDPILPTTTPGEAVTSRCSAGN